MSQECHETYHPTTISGRPVCFNMSNILAWNTGSTASTLTPYTIREQHMKSTEMLNPRCGFIMHGIYMQKTFSIGRHAPHVYYCITLQAFRILHSLVFELNSHWDGTGTGARVYTSTTQYIVRCTQVHSHPWDRSCSPIMLSIHLVIYNPCSSSLWCYTCIYSVIIISSTCAIDVM